MLSEKKILNSLHCSNKCAVLAQTSSGQAASVFFSACKFEYNIAKGKAGGGVFVVGSTGAHLSVIIFKSIFYSNSAKIDGGGLLFEGLHSLQMVETECTENKAGSSGGGLKAKVCRQPTYCSVHMLPLCMIFHVLRQCTMASCSTLLGIQSPLLHLEIWKQMFKDAPSVSGCLKGQLLQDAGHPECY